MKKIIFKSFLKRIEYVIFGPRKNWSTHYINKYPSPPEDRLYVVVNKNLLPDLQISQSIHAKDEFTLAFPDVEKQWRNKSNTIFILFATEYDIISLRYRCLKQGIIHAVVKEPDLAYAITAIAIEPGFNTLDLVKDFGLTIKEFIL